MSLVSDAGDRNPGARARHVRTGSPHGDAWGALTRTHAAISERLQDALAAADLPPLPWYEVLATVADAPEQRMKMGDLAESLVITRGGLTKLVDRLIKAGLDGAHLLRDRPPGQLRDPAARRAQAMLEEMRPVVVDELRSAFAANLTAAQARDLREALDRVRASACGQG